MDQEKFKTVADVLLNARERMEIIMEEYQEAENTANKAKEELIQLMLAGRKGGDELTVYRVYRGDLWIAGISDKYQGYKPENRYLQIEEVELIGEKVESLPK